MVEVPKEEVGGCGGAETVMKLLLYNFTVKKVIKVKQCQEELIILYICVLMGIEKKRNLMH